MPEDPAQPKTPTPQESPDSGANSPSSGYTPPEPTQPITPAEQPTTPQTDTPTQGHPAFSGQESDSAQSDTQTDQTPPQMPSDIGTSVIPPIITPPSPTRSRAKIVGSILALLILVVGIPAGVFLVRQTQEIRERAQEGVNCVAGREGVSVTNTTDQPMKVQWFVADCEGLQGGCEGDAQETTLEPGESFDQGGIPGQELCGRSWQADIVAYPEDCPVDLTNNYVPECSYCHAADADWEVPQGQCFQDGTCYSLEEYPECAECPAGQSRRVERKVNQEGICVYEQTQACQPDPSCPGYTPPPAQCTQGACGGEGKRCCSGLDDAKLCGGFSDNSKCKDGLTCQNNVCKKPPAPAPAPIACSCGDLGQDCCDNRDDAHDAYKCGNKDGSRCVAGVCTSGICKQPVGGRPPGDRDEPEPITAECRNIKAYDENWKQLNPTQLAQLKVGDTVRFAVGGTASQGTIERARFSINDADWQETISKNPFGEFFVTPYTIKPGDKTIRVKAQLRNSDPSIGWF